MPEEGAGAAAARGQLTAAAGIVRSAVAPVLAQPSVAAEQVTQLVLGETVAVPERAGEWCRVETDLDHYGGWVHEGYLRLETPESARAWRAAAILMSMGAAVQRPDGRRVRLPLRSRVAPGGADAVRLPDGSVATVTLGRVLPQEALAREAKAAPVHAWAATHFAGAPYQWGGVTPWGVDCSGLVQTTFLARGIVLPRDSRPQAEAGRAVSPDAIRPGDLLFFRNAANERIGHVAFAGAGDQIVHSTLALGGVVVESFAPGSRAGETLRPLLVAVRRIPED